MASPAVFEAIIGVVNIPNLFGTRSFFVLRVVADFEPIDVRGFVDALFALDVRDSLKDTG